MAQVRKRIFIVGLNRRKYPHVTFLFPTQNGMPKRSVRNLIAQLPPPLFFKRGTTIAEIPCHPNHWCMVPRSERFSDGSLKEGEFKGRPFRVLRWDAPSWTVAYGHREVHVHPSTTRRLSVYEATQHVARGRCLVGRGISWIRQRSEILVLSKGNLLRIECGSCRQLPGSRASRDLTFQVTHRASKLTNRRSSQRLRQCVAP